MNQEQMSWSETVAVVTSLVAIWYTIRESRRNNSVVLRLDSCKATSHHPTDGKPYSEFLVVVRNQGIPLHEVKASIGFTGPDGHGRFSLPLKRRKPDGERHEFAKGMLAEFGLRSDKLDEDSLGFLQHLPDPKSQNAEVCIFSQDYLAHRFPIASGPDAWKSKWNWLAYKVNGLFDRRVKAADGTIILHPGRVLPVFPTIAFNLLTFREWNGRTSNAAQL